MPYRTMQNPSAMISQVPVLDGSSVIFPSWRSRLEDMLAVEGVLDIVDGSLLVQLPTTNAQPNLLNSVVTTPMSCRLIGTLCPTSLDLAIRYKDIKPASKLFKTICDAYEKNTRACRILLEDNFWTARHDPNVPIAKWIARVRVAPTDLTSVKLTPGDQQICDCLLRGLDDSWKTIRDHLVYSPNEVSLDDAIGALEAHEIATSTSLDHVNADSFNSASAAKTKPTLGCWNCGKKGHHSSSCPNPSIKKKSTSYETRAGAATTTKLGNYSEYEEEEDSFDETDVKWG
ncbi:hypothetical protein PSTG_13764 [Puccinia striiformis f. sp. tritici PST-78]|uniref:CCHC-type domain-containing protein n=1 Tax=Puccinia striiformis f. sp. tritici PST-78 TaxID=1165861 RepID=A0A0L0V1G2_9BASI|nr:hypothetical protein PSTG_13764 [Puccinia striiformis f. sp. tritici PST-78]